MESTRNHGACILVASRSKARFFDRVARDKLVLTRTLEHEAGRKRDYDLETDRPGRAFSRTGTARHALTPPHDAVEHEAELFARELALTLEAAAHERKPRELVIIAEPKFLGILKAQLGPLAVRATRTIAKDLTASPEPEIVAHLEA